MKFLNYSILHRSEFCSGCKKNLNQIYKENLNKKTLELLNITDLDKDVIHHISTFLVHPYHSIIYPCNLNMLPSYLKIENSDKKDKVWLAQKRFCNKCFKIGLIQSLFVYEKRLPYKIWHIGYFTNQENFTDKKNYMQIVNKYDLPKIFQITYYREKLPKIENNKTFITQI